MLALTGGTVAATLAGCVGSSSGGDGESVEAYLLNFHWGFTLFDEDGNEFDALEIAPGTEVTLHAVNDHAYEAFEQLPDPVVSEIEDFDALGRMRAQVEAGSLPAPEEGTIEEAYNHAHGHDDEGHGHDDEGHGHDDDDHGHGDDGHGHDDDGHGHAGGALDHGVFILDLGVNLDAPADAHAPSSETFTVDDPGTYEAVCTVACGYYHAEMRDVILEVE